MQDAKETWFVIPSKRSHMASSLGRVKAKSYVDAAGKIRGERLLTVSYKSSRKSPEKVRPGFVRLVEGDTISQAYVKDLMGEVFHDGYDRRWNTVTYRDNNPRNCALDNLTFRSRFAVKLEKRLWALMALEGSGSEANAH